MRQADTRSEDDVKRKTKRIPAEQFVKVWQQASCPREVADHFGVSYQAVVGRANHYRENGIRLKKFKKGPKVDIEQLKLLADELNGQEH